MSPENGVLFPPPGRAWPGWESPARATSLVPGLSAVGGRAAQLAERTGLLPDRARAEARRAAARPWPGSSATRRSPKRSHGRLMPLADIVEPDDPAAAGQLRDRAGQPAATPLEQWLAEQASAAPHPLARRRTGAPARIRSRSRACSGRSIPVSSPKGCFCLGYRLALISSSAPDAGRTRVIVAAFLVPGLTLTRSAAAVPVSSDPSARRVLAQRTLRAAGLPGPGRTGAPLPIDQNLRGPGSKRWTTSSGRSGALAAAPDAAGRLRWADAALRAEQRPQGLAPHFTGQDWAALAVTAWERCRYDWDDTGDTDRAFLAARRRGP